MDQQGFPQDSNNYLLPPGQLPIRRRHDKEDGTEEVHFPLPPGITRSHHAESSSRSLQPLTHHSFQSSALSDRSFAPEYTVQPHQSHRRTPSNVSNDSFGPATDPRYQHSPSLFPEVDPWSSTHSRSPQDLTHFGFPPVDESQTNSFPQFPLYDNNDFSLFSPYDPSHLHATPSPFNTPSLTSNRSFYDASQSPYARSPQRQFISSQSPFSPSPGPLSPFTPGIRSPDSQCNALPSSHIRPSTFNQVSAEFAPSPFIPNQFLQTPSHSSTVSAHSTRAAHHEALPTPIIVAAHPETLDDPQISSLLTPLIPVNRVLGPVGLSEQQPLPDFTQPHFWTAPAVAPHQDSGSIPPQTTAQAEPIRAHDDEALLRELEEKEAKHEEERLEMTKEIKKVGDEINKLTEQRDALIGSGREGQKQVKEELRELRANLKRLYDELREFDKRTSPTSAQLVDVKAIVNRHANYR
ncbi:hypothetical protein JCM5353_003744 [Sporobolomyces roseus]